MTNKKVQAQMQINVSFVGNSTKLVKNLEQNFSKLNLSSGLTKQLEADLNKSFKDIYANLGKMTEGLSKKGLSSKQYEDFFNALNMKIEDSTKIFQTLKDTLSDIFTGEENKKALKTLDDLKKKLEAINKLSTSQKAAQTRKDTAIRKIKDETNIDYNVSKKMIGSIIDRRSNKQEYTKTQREWLDANKIDEDKLKRILELYKQIRAQENAIQKADEKAKKITDQSTVANGHLFLNKQIRKAEAMAYTPEDYKNNLAVLNQYGEETEQVMNMSTTLMKDFGNEQNNAVLQAQKLAQAEMTVKEILGQFGIVFSAAGMVQKFKELIKYSYEFYKSLDSALNAIYVVSNLSSNSVNKLTDEFIRMAEKTGMAIDDITQSAVLFYQQGLSTDEVLEMTEVTAQFAKVAGIDATDAADKLTAAVNGYCLAAEDAASVADKFNQVAAASAADINELSTAFSKAAAQANQAGVGMDNYLAYIATMEEATREAPENIGTSLKTIFSRMQQVKNGENTDDGETDINQVETALKSVGVALRDAQGELRNLEDVFAELGPKWQSLDRNTQAYIGTIIAGTRQQSRFITLMQNWDRVLVLAAESENSAGMQALMHAKAMESISSKTQELNVAWQEFISNLTDSTIIKSIISTLTTLLKTINSGTKPIRLLISLFILLRKQISPLVVSIGQWIKKQVLAKNTTDKMSKGFSGLIKSINLNSKAYVDINKKIQDNNTVIQNLEEEILKLMDDYSKLSNATANNTEEEDKNNKAMEKTVAAIEEKQKAIKLLKDANTGLNKKLNEMNVSFDGWTSVLNSLSMIFTTLSSSSNKVVSAIGNIVTATSQAAIVGVQAVKAFKNLSAGIKALKAGVQTSLISTGIGALVVVIGELVNLGMTLYDVFANGNEKLKESVDKVMDSIDKYQNVVISKKAVDKLTAEYKKLSLQTYLTAAEQERLNEVIQELGENLDIDYVEDAYGNLTLNITELNEAIEDLDIEKMKAFKEVLKTEKDEGYGLFGRKSGFYEEYFKGNSSTLRKIMTDFKKNIGNDLNNLFSEADFEQFNKDLQSAILDSAKQATDNFSKNFTATEFIAKTSEDINEALSDAETKAMYEFIYGLQQSMEQLSYEETMDRISGFVKAWGDAAGLTVKQIEIIQKAITNFAYGNENDNVYNIIEQLNNQIKKYEKYKDIIESMNKPEEPKRLEPSYKAPELQVGGANPNTIPEPAPAPKITEEQKQGYEHYQDLLKLKDILSNTTNQITMFLSSVGALVDSDELKSTDFLTKYINMEELQQAFSVSAEKGASVYIQQLSKAIEANRGGELEGALQDKFNRAMDSLSLPRDWSWKDIASEIGDMSSDLQTLNKVMKEIRENGEMTFDTFTDFCGILDKIINNFDDLAAAGQIENVIKALDSMKLGFDETTGAITVNGDAIQSLQQVEESLVKAQLEGIKKQLLAKNAQFDVQIELLKAEYKANEKTIQWLKSQGEADLALTDIEVEGANNYNEAMRVASSNIGSYYQDLSTDSQNYARSAVSAFTAVADVMGKMINGELTPQAAEDALKVALNNAIATWSSYTGSGLKYSGDDSGKIKANKAAEILEKQNERINSTIEDFELRKKSLGNIYNLVAQLADKGTDLSKLGIGDKDDKKIEKYIGQLKEIYNILNRISLLEHRLSTLDSYADVAQGEKYGALLNERLTYNKELISQYEFLTREQKQFTNGYKDFIQSIEGLEGVFDFDQFGQIIINWEKYNSLQDESIDGEVTLKEKADDVYDTYTQMFEDLQGYFDSSIEYYQAVIDLQEEMIDNYITMENKAANAVKEIYQDMLDTRLEAIDKEKDALEELREARQKSREDQENAEAISNLQTNIQRTMMDTSGASDSSFIKAQQDMTDKLEDIADDKYSEMLDDIIEKLEEEKDALQKQFDELFDNLEWLFSWLDKDIMGDESALFELFKQTDEWRQMSDIERNKTLDEWKTQFYSYYDTMINHEKGIFGIYQNITDTRERINKLDENLKTNIGKGSYAIIESISKWTSNNSKNNSSGGGGGSTPNYRNYFEEDTKNKGNLDTTINGNTNIGKEITLEDTSYRKWIGKTVEIKGSGTMEVLNSPNEKDSKYVNNPAWYNPNVIIQDVWKSPSDIYWLKTDWKDGVWVKAENLQTTGLLWGGKPLSPYKQGGFAYHTGPAWLDGTKQRPEAVLNALQTEHFIKFTNALDNMFSNGNSTNASSSINIENISFNVESMSSPEDGEAAFNMFVNKFKEIGNQTGIRMNSFKNTL